jgi:hypothetical protein
MRIALGYAFVLNIVSCLTFIIILFCLDLGDEHGGLVQR